MAQNPATRKCPDDGPENADCVGETGIELDTFSFIWEVSNYSILSDKYELESPLFRGGPKTNHGWKLMLRPKYKDASSSANYVSVYLEFIEYGIPMGEDEIRGTPIKTHFQISILDSDGQPNIHAFQPSKSHDFTKYGSNSWGQSKIITSADLVDPSRHLVVNDTLKIFCELSIYGGIKEQMVPCKGRLVNEQRAQLCKERLAMDLGKTFKESIATDCTVWAGETPFKAHKIILSARSSGFAVMFNANMMEQETATVKITDFDEQVVKGMLEYLYTGETTVMTTRAQELFQIAEKYNLEGLKEDCEYAIGESLSKENAASVLAHTHNAPYLKSRAISFINWYGIDKLEIWTRKEMNKEELLNLKSFQDEVKALDYTGLFADLYLGAKK